MSNLWFQRHNVRRRYTLLAALPDPPCEFCGGDLAADRSSTRCARCGQVPLHEDTLEALADGRLESDRPARIPRAFARADPPAADS